MVPPPCQTTGRSRQRRHSANPLLQLGSSLTRASDQADRVLPSGTPRSPASPADRNGSHPKGVADLPLTKGRPREQCRRRPQGRNGCEEDDRNSDPRFRSAPTERQASVGCERYLQHRRRLSSRTRPPAVTDPARQSPDPGLGRRGGHSAKRTKTVPWSPIRTGSTRESRPTVPSFWNSRAQHRTRPLCAPPETPSRALMPVPSGQRPRRREGAPARRQHGSRPRRPPRVPLARAKDGRVYPSGRPQTPRRRRRRVIRQGRSASGGPAKRVDTATAVAFPASGDARRRRSAIAHLLRP